MTDKQAPAPLDRWRIEVRLADGEWSADEWTLIYEKDGFRREFGPFMESEAIAVRDALNGLAAPRAPEGPRARWLLEAAENVLRGLGQQFSAPNFTDRHEDGPKMLKLASEIKEYLDNATR